MAIWDVDDTIKEMKLRRHFPDLQASEPLCKRCGWPVVRAKAQRDSAGNEQDNTENYCARCLGAIIQSRAVGCDE